MHPRNKHTDRYDMKKLAQSCPMLSQHIHINKYGSETIDFGNPVAVKLLNQAILKSDYGLSYWEIPDNYLCPPIPGRADYLHHLADLLASCDEGQIPKGSSIHGLDIGVGANSIYPVIGSFEYGWRFIGSEIDQGAFKSAEAIIRGNNHLRELFQLRLQPTAGEIFKGVILSDEQFDFTMCNPPFHSSAEEASEGNKRKQKNLGLKSGALNFGGQNQELWCHGGEKSFILKMIKESESYHHQCLWFTSLVSKKENLITFQKELKKISATDVRVIEMSQGQKKSRILAWTFQNQNQQKTWVKNKWKQK
jgi:23S rRNA (adenine1618-N6)-methyltransferase